eukprot:scaffold35032_cov72-Cyclotella_meneghiniana.AAC.2
MKITNGYDKKGIKDTQCIIIGSTFTPLYEDLPISSATAVDAPARRELRIIGLRIGVLYLMYCVLDGQKEGEEFATR